MQTDCFKKCENDATDALDKLKANIVTFGRDYHIGKGSARWRPQVGAWEGYSYLSEQHDISILPQDLVDALVNQVYPSYYGPGTYSKSDIEEAHTRFLRLFEPRTHISFPDVETDHELVLWLRKLMEEVGKNGFYGILIYRNGDIAYYCPKDDMVHDFNRRSGYFAIYSLRDPTVWNPQPYRKWIDDVTKWRHVTSYYNDNYEDNRGKKDGVGFTQLGK